MKPEVSIIIPVRNGERTIARAIDSALSQKFNGTSEIVVSNDGSTDLTANVLARYGDRIRIVDSPSSSGVAVARNAAVSASSGEYIAFLDADDEWMPQKLARVISVLDAAPEVILVYHDAAMVDLNGEIQEPTIFAKDHCAPSFQDLLNPPEYKGKIYPSTVVMRRATFDACGGFNEQLTSCEDYYLWIRAHEHGEFQFVPEVLSRREFERSRAREQWYVDGARVLNRIARERYGSRFNVDFLPRLLLWAGRSAYLRGDRMVAFKRLFAALLHKPLAPNIYFLLGVSVIPLKITATIFAMMPCWVQEKIIRKCDGRLSLSLRSRTFGSFGRRSPEAWRG